MVGASVVLAGAAASGLALGWFGAGAAPVATPSESPSPSVSAAPASPEPPDDFVARTVTEAPHVPSALPITAQAVASAGPGWVLAIHDATAYGDGGSSSSGPRVLYLIDPSGVRYEVANLDALGLSEPDLIAWDPQRHRIALSQARSEVAVVSMMTGAVVHQWVFCESPGYVRGTARDGAWILRGTCQGNGIDGLYTDDGTPRPSAIVGSGFGYTVFDVGDVQVVSEFETPPDARFTVVGPDGAATVVASADAGDCYLLGRGSGSTFAAYCYADDGQVEVWEFPVDGATPRRVVDASQLDAFRVAVGVPGQDDIFVSGYCASPEVRLVQVSWGESRLGAVDVDGLVPVGAPPHVMRACDAASDLGVLVSGDGLLWYVDDATGTTVELLPGAGDEAPLHVVGTDGYHALLYPE